jgi:hypothetical protein
MADHVRTQLSAAVRVAVTGLPMTMSNVFGFRVFPLQAYEMPALCVYTVSEDAEPLTIHFPLYERTVELHVVGFTERNDMLDEDLDQIGKEVEIALAPGVTVSGKQVQLIYTRSEKDFEAAEKTAGSIDMTFTAQLATAADQPYVLS